MHCTCSSHSMQSEHSVSAVGQNSLSSLQLSITSAQVVPWHSLEQRNDPSGGHRVAGQVNASPVGQTAQFSGQWARQRVQGQTISLPLSAVAQSTVEPFAEQLKVAAGQQSSGHSMAVFFSGSIADNVAALFGRFDYDKADGISAEFSTTTCVSQSNGSA